MKRLLGYLFILLGLGLTFNINSNGKEINKEFYKFKKILVPLSEDGSWKLIGKKTQSIYDAQLTFKYLAQTKDGQLSKLIELVHVSEARESPSQTFTWFKNFLYQENGFSSCIPKNSTLREKYYIYEESGKSSCFFTRNMDIENEILYPTIRRETKWVDTNHFPKIVKKYINNEIKFPKIMLRSDHYFFNQRGLYAYFEMINPEVNGAPNTLFKSEKKSEYHPLNIDNHPQKKDFYLTWIKNQAEKHSKFESELKRKNKINLAKYINYEPVNNLKDNSATTQIVKKESEKIKKKIAKKKNEEKKIVKKETKIKTVEKKIKSSEVNFYKIKKGDIIDNPVVSISKSNKISLPKGTWQVAKKSKIPGWISNDNIIFINQLSSNSTSVEEFIEISVSKSIKTKSLSYVIDELKKPCKKKYYFHDLQKTSGSGNSFSCFATGFVENKIFQSTQSSQVNPWSYKFRDYFLKKGTLADHILFSLSAYSSKSSTNSKTITVVYGSSLKSISDKNDIDFENKELIKNIWNKKTIGFHNNFQNNMNFNESHIVNLDTEYQDLENRYADLMNVDKSKKIVKKETKIKTKKKKVKVAKIEEQKKEVIKSVSNEKKIKKIVKSSEVNFYKIKKGDIIDNPVVSISKSNKISLPKGTWQVAKKSKIPGWISNDNIIFINQLSSNSTSVEEFIEISVSKSIKTKSLSYVIDELKKPCKKKYYFHDLQKTSGSGNSFSCFATGFVENKIFQSTQSSQVNPWSYKFRDYFLKKGTLADHILFSLSAYSSKSSTNSKTITVVYGSSLKSISDKNDIDFENKELIKNIWNKKTIGFHNNFQNNMNFNESHIVNLDTEYQDLENRYADLMNVDKSKKIVKKETKIKTKKKKVKVANVEEPKQEEFKPKKINKDNEAPVIEIAETITMSDSDYEFKGKVTDQAKTVYIEVDGYPIDVSEGIFTVSGYSPVDKQISIIAIDQYGNKSQPKLVNIIIDQKDTIVADIFETLNPSNIDTESNKNRVALIIGIEKYDQTPEASFANLDAKYFFDYSRKAFGVSKSNIKLLVDEDANLIKSLGTLSKWLPSKIKDGETELIIFFAGHGLASSDGKELYLLPQDGDPDLLERTALSRTELFKEIISLNPKSVTMFLDTCYSGVSRDEKTLLASARPVRVVAKEQDIPNNFTIFSASQLDQISSGLKEANHGIFSYYLMKGLEGKADINNDKRITNGELLAYMDENVSQKASELGRKQNPSFAGDPDKVLISYR